MGIVSKLKRWSVATAFGAGVLSGSIGTVRVTQDQYLEDAKVITCSDTLIAAHKDSVYRDSVSIVGNDTTVLRVFDRLVDVPKAVQREAVYVRFAPDSGDVVRAPVFINGKICGEISYTITEKPLPPNDALAAVVKLHIRPDRVAPIEEIGELEVKK